MVNLKDFHFKQGKLFRLVLWHSLFETPLNSRLRCQYWGSSGNSAIPVADAPRNAIPTAALERAATELAGLLAGELLQLYRKWMEVDFYAGKNGGFRMIMVMIGDDWWVWRCPTHQSLVFWFIPQCPATQEPLHLKHQNQWQLSSMRLQILRACGFMVDQFHECLDIYWRRMESLNDNMV